MRTKSVRKLNFYGVKKASWTEVSFDVPFSFINRFFFKPKTKITPSSHPFVEVQKIFSPSLF